MRETGGVGLQQAVPDVVRAMAHFLPQDNKKGSMPHVLELCCGWKSVSSCFVQDHGWTATTIDVLPKFKPTIQADVTAWDYRKYYKEWDWERK